MGVDPLTVDQMRVLINKGELQDPLIFLESVMCGQDPRQLSHIYRLALDINDFSGGEPSREEWDELFQQIEKKLKYQEVDFKASSQAAKTLAEYLHAKRKQIETFTSNSLDLASQPLTAEEVELFKERFNAEF